MKLRTIKIKLHIRQLCKCAPLKGVTPQQGQRLCWGWGKAVDSYFCIIIKEGIACL